MLEHQKFILANISSVKPLFKKELMKSLNWLSTEEVIELHRWLIKNYWDTHNDLIAGSFLFVPK
jgi:hypothetical protein